MKVSWYLDRLKKMSLFEVIKRVLEHIGVVISRIHYRKPSNWPYQRFCSEVVRLRFHPFMGIPLETQWQNYGIYSLKFNLTEPLDWYFSENSCSSWPKCHYSRINYRPGNPHGDVRINWELSRLQFLPSMAVTNSNLARSIIVDWLEKNPYQHGPGYIASMEVAIRWISVYWAACIINPDREDIFLKSLTGLAVSSGRFIESRLSTHSSAGNHLIVEAVGLFWLGKALEGSEVGDKWIEKGRNILKNEVPRQINSDGSNQEQSFWYLGFVLDALFHYFLLEDPEKIPLKIKSRVEKMLDFINKLTLSNGSFPDYGDRDDGFIFRLNSNYEESPFPGLLNTGSLIFKRSEWQRNTRQSKNRLLFWASSVKQKVEVESIKNSQSELPSQPELNVYKEGGLTLMQWGNGRLIFKHGYLGLGNTCGHGHADALSVLFYWREIPVLIDLGSGQYNGDQAIRRFFRSTIAHNTIEIGEKNQAKILGPFLWEKSYKCQLNEAGDSPSLFAEASHDGYLDEFSVLHTRRVEWFEPNKLTLFDSFSGSGGIPIRGAFHLGACRNVSQIENMINVDFGDFIFSITLPSQLLVSVFYGSNNPFMGWQSTRYGKWEPNYSIMFSGKLQKNDQYKINFIILEE